MKKKPPRNCQAQHASNRTVPLLGAVALKNIFPTNDVKVELQTRLLWVQNRKQRYVQNEDTYMLFSATCKYYLLAIGAHINN